jgi:hypothetical protein
MTVVTVGASTTWIATRSSRRCVRPDSGMTTDARPSAIRPNSWVGSRTAGPGPSGVPSRPMRRGPGRPGISVASARVTCDRVVSGCPAGSTRICPFGSGGNPDHDDCIRIITKALDAGINFVDTADRYSNGESEQIVGKAIKGRRDEIVLATKFFGPMGDDPNRQGASRRWIMTAVEDSLRRLQVDHIELYQLHRPSPETDIEETLSALTDLVRSGKVRAIGASTMPASEMVEAQ